MARRPVFADSPFVCNLCGHPGVFRQAHFDNPELPSCAVCGSNVRFRWLIHRLSVEFAPEQSIRGVGLTDPPAVAALLARRYNYTNTFFHVEPRLDIREESSAAAYGPADFLIASEVFEHVEAPVDRAFRTAARLLRRGGLLLLTVPWVWDGDPASAIPELYDWRLTADEEAAPGDEAYVIVNRRPDGTGERFRHMAFDGSPGPSFGRTREHFPHGLHRWRLLDDSTRLENTHPDGTVETFTNISFHGGPGLALEMRLFTKRDIEAQLRGAGFANVAFAVADLPELGIIFGHPWSRPLSAQRI